MLLRAVAGQACSSVRLLHAAAAVSTPPRHGRQPGSPHHPSLRRRRTRAAPAPLCCHRTTAVESNPPCSSAPPPNQHRPASPRRCRTNAVEPNLPLLLHDAAGPASPLLLSELRGRGRKAPLARRVLGLAAGFLGSSLLLAPMLVMAEDRPLSFPAAGMPAMDTVLAAGRRAEQAYGQQEVQERTLRRGSNFWAQLQQQLHHGAGTRRMGARWLRGSIAPPPRLFRRGWGAENKNRKKGGESNDRLTCGS
ncbi:hypothetical protein PVAP13_3KG172827 [Panicum virgatum]|uniref:Uncharacterized protein n=1 Tax=Panicum virgatum TaxID=38727 RepID=A0A8T0UUB2_PANVG|nr:hypothetical protein PVAP13_3KG172827 [Panicum virgatum]